MKVIKSEKYWFYLEPYTFLFVEKGEEPILYNTINSSYIVVAKENDTLNRVVEEWDVLNNGYCAILTEEELNNPVVNAFVENVRITFSGDLIPCLAFEHKPFIFKPHFRITEKTFLDEQEKDKNIHEIGIDVLRNLNEVSVYINDLPTQSYCDVFRLKSTNSNYHEKENLTPNDYLRLFRNLNTSGVSKVNIWKIDLSDSDSDSFLSTLSFCNFKKVFYLTIEQLSNNFQRLQLVENSDVVIHIYAPYDENYVLNRMHQYSDLPIEWIFVVTTENELIQIEQLQEKTNANISVIPFYDGGNLAFFEEFVFNTIEDIIADPIDKQTIFRRQVLNENFFGKLTILPSGDVYANLNCKSIGNILQHSLAELVYKEMTESTAWFKTRNEGKCKNCVNKYLCPSPSNYEFVLQRENLCHVL